MSPKINPLVAGAASAIIVLLFGAGCVREGFHPPRPPGPDAIPAEGISSRDSGDLSGPGPALSLDSPIRVVDRASSVSFSGRCEAGLDVTVSGQEQAVLPCDAGSYTFTSQPQTSDGERVYHFEQTDAVGNLARVTGTWIRDTTPPELSANGMTINGGAISTHHYFVEVSLAGVDASSHIVAFALAWNDTTTPAPDASSWVAVNAPVPGLQPDKTLELSRFGLRLGFTPGRYDVYAWLKDEAGNISALSANGQGIVGLDRASIDYAPGSPPQVTSILATNSAAPSDPPTQGQLQISQGSTLTIKWRATDAEGLSVAPISLYVTSDEKTHTPIAQGLANGSNGGCVVDDPGTSADDDATGCYRWTASAAANGYFRARVSAEDLQGAITSATSSPLNAPSIRFLAGNTDPGTNTSATAAMFFNVVHVPRDYADSGSFVITSKGTVYFRDVLRGLLVVDPADGIQRVLIPSTGAATGDGGAASQATLHRPFKIALDYQERLLIFDHDTIRRVDTSVTPPTIERIIGGGDVEGDDVAPLDLKITPPSTTTLDAVAPHTMPFFALPNGDIYFQSDLYSQPPVNGSAFRIYRATTGRVEKLSISGTSDAINPGQDIRHCRISNLGVTFDPLTSTIDYAQVAVHYFHTMPDCWAVSQAAEQLRIEIETGVVTPPHAPAPHSFSTNAYPHQGRDGKLYLVSRHGAAIFRFDAANHAFVKLVGTGIIGACADGTDALACGIDPQDAFVDARGTLYFMDRGRLRTLDREGRVVTLLGQSYTFGDGETPLSARFGTATTLGLYNEGSGDRFVLFDRKELRIREFYEGGLVSTRAGNGRNAAPNTSDKATEQGLFVQSSGRTWEQMVVHPQTGTIYLNRGKGAIAQLPRATGLWQDLVGGGSVNCWDAAADGLPGDQILFGGAGYPPELLGFDGSRILGIRFHVVDRVAVDSLLKSYAITDGTQGHVAGVVGAAGYDCPDGVSLASCRLPASYDLLRAVYDARGSRWLLGIRNRPEVRVTQANRMQTLVTLPLAPTAFAYKRDQSLSTHIIFYCAGGALYRYDINSGSQTTIALPSPTLRCSGFSLLYSESRDSLVFGFAQNNLAGVAEVLAP